MYRRSRRHKKFPDLALAILGVVAFVTLGALLFINDKQEKEQQAKYEQIAREEREKQKEIETQYNIILTQDNIAFLDDSEAEEVISMVQKKYRTGVFLACHLLTCTEEGESVEYLKGYLELCEAK